MVIRLHRNARITPAVRREFQESTLLTRELAERYRLDSDARPVLTFKNDKPGFVHINVKYLCSECRMRTVLSDRATRWVHVEILPDKTHLGIAL